MNCRILLTAGLMATGALAASAQPEITSMFPAPAYITLQKANAVEVFPSGTRWHGVTAAHYDDVSPDGRLVLVTSAEPGQVFVLDAHSGRQLARLPIGKATQGVQVAPNGRLALAVDPLGGTAAVIDLRRLKVIKILPVGGAPHNILFSPDGRLAYVTLQGGTGVAVVDMNSLKKTGEIPIPGLVGPHNMDFSGHARLLWVRDVVNHVAVVDLRTHKVLHYIKVGYGHGGLDVIPGERYVFTAAIADHVVSVIDPQTYRVVKTIDVGPSPHGVRASPDGRWVYVEITKANKLVVIDTHTLKIARQISIPGALPFWGAVPGNR